MFYSYALCFFIIWELALVQGSFHFNFILLLLFTNVITHVNCFRLQVLVFGPRVRVNRTLWTLSRRVLMVECLPPMDSLICLLGFGQTGLAQVLRGANWYLNHGRVRRSCLDLRWRKHPSLVLVRPFCVRQIPSLSWSFCKLDILSLSEKGSKWKPFTSAICWRCHLFRFGTVQRSPWALSVTYGWE